MSTTARRVALGFGVVVLLGLTLPASAKDSVPDPTRVAKERVMNCTTRNAIACCLSIFCLAPLTSVAHAQWTAPTDEELKITSQPEVPGAAAVYLFREEVTDDKLHMWSEYVRLKVLTEGGKKYANVELNRYSSSEHGGYTVNDIAGRTIHPDGTIMNSP